MIKLNPYRITYRSGTTQVIFGRDSKDACARSKVNPKTIRVLRAAHDVNPMWEEDEAEQVQFELGLTGVMFALAGGEAYLAYLQRGHEQNRADRLALRYLRFVVANNGTRYYCPHGNGERVAPRMCGCIKTARGWR